MYLNALLNTNLCRVREKNAKQKKFSFFFKMQQIELDIFALVYASFPAPLCLLQKHQFFSCKFHFSLQQVMQIMQDHPTCGLTGFTTPFPSLEYFTYFSSSNTNEHINGSCLSHYSKLNCCPSDTICRCSRNLKFSISK